MDFGIHIGTRGCLTKRDAIMGLARRAEADGYAYLGAADHLILPGETSERYPDTANGVWPGAPSGECFDAIATLAFLAGCTQRIKPLTSVVVPHRPAVLAAKLLLAANVLSGGRDVAGVGVGWMREEFEALGAPAFAERGAITGEYLRAWKALWTGIRSSHRTAEKAGRDPASIDIAYVWLMPPSWTPRIGPDRGRQMFSGTADDVLADVAALRGAGVRHMMLYVQRRTLTETLDLQQRFAENVMRKVK